MSAISIAAQDRWPSILTALGVGEEFLTNRHGPCPICGGTDRYRFDDKNGKGTYYCGQCGAGDGFNLLMKFKGWDFRTAAKEVERIVGECEPTQTKRTVTDPAIRIKRIAENARKLDGNDPASQYLKSRMLYLAPGLRYAQNEPYYNENGAYQGSYPAMLGPVQSPQGRLLTWQVTYLDNGKKAPVAAPKKTMRAISKINGAAIRLFDYDDHLGIAEGIETAIAAYMLNNIPTWAVLGTSGMESFIVPDGVKKLTIFGDNDKNFAGQKSAYFAANKHTLAGIEVEVCIPPQQGQDWDDVLTELRS